ncbi:MULTISPECIES: hypothetical protein [Sphingobacterium]|uniref:Uncharacterized protein n=1 Tax=Sphingobacterium litopenaei TaxID=2763500 RepID=A0ABR7YDD1_9SPHI|nr:MULTISPECIES: hypothetical protein [Sphingobacterium]MBD1429307.1 hypothetical protein [Sphingobacterium litopenaei]NGM73577.1 hypothetical protein [Sphingobacterium sp. SGL-16]
MNKLTFLLICFLLPIISFAQKNKKVNYSFARTNDLTIDANVEDWGGNLNAVADDFWSFGITEQNNELIVAIVVKDLQLQREAFRGGLFVDISYDEKKKDGARLNFPYWDRERKRAIANDEEMDQKKFEQELLNNVNGYYLTGFGRVRDGVLALDNDYGIQAKVQVDSNKCLVYEAKIPLDLVGVKSNQIAVHLGINTQFAMLKKAAENARKRNNNMYSPYGYGMMGRPMMQNTLKNPYKGDTEIWVIDTIK